ncbi:MAG: SelB C-terminal domain-containing protein, partial [Paracoccaceae bacterium]|nr:SelB C-terminal domain-containing protein [Paracoccaceae bacterium]
FVLHGDRFVLRDQSAQRTIAGGRVIDPFSPKRGRARPSRIVTLTAMRGKTTAEILQALVAHSKTGVALHPFLVSHNLPAPQIYALIDSLGLQRVGNTPKERIFCEARWCILLESIVTGITTFHQLRPTLFGPSIKDIQVLLTPFIDTVTLNVALRILVTDKRLGARGNRFHLPSYEMHVSEQDQSLLAQAATVLAPDSGAPPSLYQAAKEIGVEATVLEKTLKIGMKLGDILLVEKNRYVPKTLLTKLEVAAEQLASRSTDGLFTSVEYRNEINMGRNFVIAVLEYFDRVGFTLRVGNRRRIYRSAADVLSVESEN